MKNSSVFFMFLASVLCFSEEMPSGGIAEVSQKEVATWRNYDLGDVSILTWNTPTLINKQNNKKLRSLPELRLFLYNNFYKEEQRKELYNEITGNNNLLAALFMALSAKHIMPAHDADKVMRLLRGNIDKLKPINEKDASAIDKFMGLKSIIVSYFALDNEPFDRAEPFKRILKVKSMKELVDMREDVMASEDDELKLVYLTFYLGDKKMISDEDRLLISELRKSPKISRELYQSMRAIIELMQNDYSDSARYTLMYNVTIGCPFGLVTARSISNYFHNYEEVGYLSYLNYKDHPYHASAASDLVAILYYFIIRRNDKDAAVLYGFMEAAGKVHPEYLVKLHGIDKHTSQLKSRANRTLYNYNFNLGKEQYEKNNVYENPEFELGILEAMFAACRLNSETGELQETFK